MNQIEMDVLRRAEIALKKINDIELRDLFAMQALNGILGGNVKFDGTNDFSPELLAFGAYRLADAMLEARKKK